MEERIQRFSQAKAHQERHTDPITRYRNLSAAVLIMSALPGEYDFKM